MPKLADIHCHVLPYVDDGAEHVEEMERLLTAQAGQGVRILCATPHLREKMFESSDETVSRQFERAKAFAQSEKLPLRLCLSREYFCDARFLERLERGELLPLGEGNTVLVEFSGRCSLETICGYIRKIVNAGYQPLAAHVERYSAVNVHVDSVSRLISLGALIQINAGSVLGREGSGQKRFCWKLMKRNLVHVVASDAHGPEYRPPELDLCAAKIERKMGQAYAKAVLWDNPLKILSLDKGEV